MSDNLELGRKIARHIIAIGDGPRKCWRVQFMGGTFEDENPQGGLCEDSLAAQITYALNKFTSQPPTIETP